MVFWDVTLHFITDRYQCFAESTDSIIRDKENSVQMWWVIRAGYNKGTWEMARTNNAALIDPIHFDPVN
jgi:hypothetical protein